MVETQYQHYHDFPKEQLGSMASQYWRDDPKLLGIHLARYKFVSKMLAGKIGVAEVGCGDGWFSKVVREQVRHLDLYDFDKRFIDEIYARGEGNACCHDILSGKLEDEYDGIYSLDVMEHIEPDKQNLYLTNIKKSLLRNGVFIVGMPSLESQAYASKASKIGHINCQSGEELKTALEDHFFNVFLFSMNDEVIHTGFYPMAHYLMAVCCGIR